MEGGEEGGYVVVEHGAPSGGWGAGGAEAVGEEEAAEAGGGFALEGLDEGGRVVGV